MVRRVGPMLVGLLVLLGLTVAVGTQPSRAATSTLRLSWAEAERALVTDPHLWGSYAWIDVSRSGFGPWDASWSLLDSSGAVVLGPVVAWTGETGVAQTLTVDPENHGIAIPAGDYTLSVAVTATGASAPETATLPLRIIDPPPRPTAPTPTTLRSTIWDDRPDHAPASWRVPALALRSVAAGRLIVRNAAGKVVETAEINPSWCPVGHPSCDYGYPPVPTYYPIEWWGYGSDRGMQPPGIYTASAEIPDPYGQAVTVPLGRLRIYDALPATRTVTARAAAHRAGRVVGRCSAIRVPGPRHVRGSVGLLSDSRCGSQRRNADVAVQRFRLRLPDVPMIEVGELAAGGRTVPLAGPRHNRYRVRFRVPGVTGWRAEPFNAQRGWGEVSWLPAFPNRLDLGGRTVEIEIRVANGNRVDLRRLQLRLSYWHWSLS